VNLRCSAAPSFSSLWTEKVTRRPPAKCDFAVRSFDFYTNALNSERCRQKDVFLCARVPVCCFQTVSAISSDVTFMLSSKRNKKLDQLFDKEVFLLELFYYRVAD